jgi:hypothetical protein
MSMCISLGNEGSWEVLRMVCYLMDGVLRGGCLGCRLYRLSDLVAGLGLMVLMSVV